ncbi:MAG: hypothetical protein ACI831_001598 [Candidatus Azotimanducaceae bacterium]|jgi:hypothetical protein
MSLLIVFAILVVGGWISMNVATPNTKVIGLNLENREPPIPPISIRNPELSLFRADTGAIPWPRSCASGD